MQFGATRATARCAYPPLLLSHLFRVGRLPVSAGRRCGGVWSVCGAGGAGRAASLVGDACAGVACYIRGQFWWLRRSGSGCCACVFTGVLVVCRWLRVRMQLTPRSSRAHGHAWRASCAGAVACTGGTCRRQAHHQPLRQQRQPPPAFVLRRARGGHGGGRAARSHCTAAADRRNCRCQSAALHRRPSAGRCVGNSLR